MKEYDPILAAISRQLYKYYDIELDIYGAHYVDSDSGYTIAVVIGSTEDSISHIETVKFKKFPHTIEDLYLFDGNGFIEPTTTQEQQNDR